MVWLLAFFVAGVAMVINGAVGVTGHSVFADPDWVSWYNVSYGGFAVAVTTRFLAPRLFGVCREAVARWTFKRAFGVSPKLDPRIVQKAVHVEVEKAMGRLRGATVDANRLHRTFEACASGLMETSGLNNEAISHHLSVLRRDWRAVKAARKDRKNARRRLRRLVALAVRYNILVEVPSEAASLGVADLFRQVA